MSVRPAGDPGPRTASRVLASAPWVIVLLGVALLAAMLVVALLAFRGPERRPAATPPPAQPLSMPSLPALPGEPAASPLAPTPTRTAVPPSTPATSRPPVPAVDPSPDTAAGRPGADDDGELTAGYRVTGSDRDSFTARLVIRNGTDESRDWRVELLFGGNVKSIAVSSGGSGISVTATGGGGYVLRGTSPLGAGQTRTIGLRFTRHGTGDRPGTCTVNGAACVIG